MQEILSRASYFVGHFSSNLSRYVNKASRHRFPSTGFDLEHDDRLSETRHGRGVDRLAYLLAVKRSRHFIPFASVDGVEAISLLERTFYMESCELLSPFLAVVTRILSSRESCLPDPLLRTGPWCFHWRMCCASRPAWPHSSVC